MSPVAYSYLVVKYQMSSGPYGPIFSFSILKLALNNVIKRCVLTHSYEVITFDFFRWAGEGVCWQFWEQSYHREFGGRDCK